MLRLKLDYFVIVFHNCLTNGGSGLAKLAEGIQDFCVWQGRDEGDVVLEEEVTGMVGGCLVISTDAYTGVELVLGV